VQREAAEGFWREVVRRNGWGTGRRTEGQGWLRAGGVGVGVGTRGNWMLPAARWPRLRGSGSGRIDSYCGAGSGPSYIHSDARDNSMARQAGNLSTGTAPRECGRAASHGRMFGMHNHAQSSDGASRVWTRAHWCSAGPGVGEAVWVRCGARSGPRAGVAQRTRAKPVPLLVSDGCAYTRDGEGGTRGP